VSLFTGPDNLAVIRAASVTPERVKWLWPGRIPFGKLTVTDGDPGLGKSTVILDVSARTTTASPMPDGHRPDTPRGVLLLSAEDGVADTIVPRLTAAGANLELVTIIDHVTDDDGPRPVELPADIDRIQTYTASLLYGDDDQAWSTPGLVVVDPLMAFLAGTVNANSDQDVRRVLYRLKVMAEETGCAVVAIRHLNKRDGGNPLYRGGGSIGIIGAARAGLLVGVDPDDDGRRILAVSKSNLAAKPTSLAYRLVGDGRLGVAKVVWDGATEHTAEDLLGRPAERPAPKLEAAEAFLEKALATEARPVTWLQKVAKDRRLSWRTVQTAKEALEVIAWRKGEEGRKGGGAWWWRLPAGQLSIKDATTSVSPDCGLNPDPESAGQGTDSEVPAVKDATTREEEGAR
jgi:hypothetical protein